MGPNAPPAGPRVRTHSRGDTVEFVIPPAVFSSGPVRCVSAGMLVFAAYCLLFGYVWAAGAVQSEGFHLLAWAISIPFLFVGATFIFLAVRLLLLEVRIVISPDHFLIQKQVFCWGSQVQGRRADVAYVDLKVSGDIKNEVVIVEGAMEHSVGDTLEVEQRPWLASELACALGVRAGAVPHTALPVFQAVPPALVVTL